MSLARVHNFAISLDGFGTGEGQTDQAHFGHAGERLHEWMFDTRWWGAGGSGGVDDAFVQRHDPGIGAEIMGAGKFGHPGWHEDPEWKGAWGPNPPFHTPVFVLTHHTRPSIEMEGGTTFHFIDGSAAEALETAREAAGGEDVRIGGGATMIREFLAAGLVDHMHVVVVPILLGPGRAALGRAGGPRAGLRDRGHLLAQRRHPRDVHPPLTAVRKVVLGAGALGGSRPGPPRRRGRTDGRARAARREAGRGPGPGPGGAGRDEDGGRDGRRRRLRARPGPHARGGVRDRAPDRRPDRHARGQEDRDPREGPRHPLRGDRDDEDVPRRRGGGARRLRVPEQAEAGELCHWGSSSGWPRRSAQDDVGELAAWSVDVQRRHVATVRGRRSTSPPTMRVGQTASLVAAAPPVLVASDARGAALGARGRRRRARSR